MARNQRNGALEVALARANFAASSNEPEMYAGAIRDAIAAGYNPAQINSRGRALLEEAKVSLDSLKEVNATATRPSGYLQRTTATFNMPAFKKSYEKHRNEGIAPRNIYQGRMVKQIILQDGGYTHVYVKGGRKIPLPEASDAQVGSMFENRYDCMIRIAPH